MNSFTAADVVAYFGDLASIAWPILQRRPDLAWPAVRKIASKVDERDTFGRLGETGAKCKTRYRVGFDLAEHDLGSPAVPVADLSDSPILSRLPVEFRQALSEGESVKAAAERSGMPLRSAFRLLAEIREHAGTI